jgi:hypothetical protein
MKVPFRLARRVSLGAMLAVLAALGGCYVVPLQAPPNSAVLQAPLPAPAPLTFSARLYPTNESAAAHGPVVATVTNDLNGRGRFSTRINGESFSGEATRIAGSSREGLANGAGSRGGYINCRYTMNSATLGTGSCRMSDGAVFSMHLGG